MLTKEKILFVLKENKKSLTQYGVQKIGLFGSYANGSFTKDSDVDIFLETTNTDYKNILNILLHLEKSLNTKVDLIYNGPHIRPSFSETLKKEVIYA